ncbi:competence protein ComK [Paraliobacillus sediminis]|uniref:competence protein ComK n=1 Tax=Paraliobacillus sediminis TaxID=1885916 RepID=UPI003B83236D
MYQTGVKRKVPIPINLMKNIHAFPTQSPSQFECKWIFYNHVLLIKPNHSNSTYKSIITFKNLQELPMYETYYVLEKQMHRTAISMYAFATD